MSNKKSAGFFNKWTVIIVLLVAVIIISAAIAWARHEPGQPIEISIEPEPPLQGDIYVGGEVNSPGLYPFKAGDTIDDIIGVAGGRIDTANPGRLELVVNGETGDGAPQKININEAEAWLLGALLGIGEGRAQAIIDYRDQHGPFRATDGLLKVPGIGETTFENIKDLITVSER